MNRRELFAGLGTAFVAGEAVARQPAKLMLAKRKMYDAAYFENIEVLTHENKRVRFYEDLLQNKLVLVSMMYATCEGICPANTANLKRVHTLLGDKVGERISFLSITLRPEDDTPDVLKRYMRENDIGSHWTFVTGTKRDIERLRFKLGFYDSDPEVDGDRSQHTGIVRIGNDRYDRWVMSPAVAAPEQIVSVIATVDRDFDWRAGKPLQLKTA
jgi:protein SCO1